MYIEDMKVLYSGWDGLDLALKGRLPSALWCALDAAQQSARQGNDSELCEWRGQRFHVTGTGARGGYAWTMDFGPEAFILWAKRDSRSDQWNLRASFRSAFLCTYGMQGARDRFYEALWAIGADVGEAHISRMDFCVDVLADGFVLEPDAFVMHSQTTRGQHPGMEDAEGDVQIIGRSGRVESVTVGKMPGKQVCFYNKRREVVVRQKHEWWPVWERAHGAPLCRKTAPVWRVELRAGKEHLKKAWNLRTWDDLDRLAQDVLLSLLQSTRYTVPNEADANRSRWEYHPIWETVCTEIQRGLGRGGVVEPGTVTRIRRAALASQVAAMMAGMAATYAFTQGEAVLDQHALAARVATLIARQLETEDPERILKGIARAARRYVFIMEGEGESVGDRPDATAVRQGGGCPSVEQGCGIGEMGPYGDGVHAGHIGAG